MMFCLKHACAEVCWLVVGSHYVPCIMSTTVVELQTLAVAAAAKQAWRLTKPHRRHATAAALLHILSLSLSFARYHSILYLSLSLFYSLPPFLSLLLSPSLSRSLNLHLLSNHDTQQITVIYLLCCYCLCQAS